MWERNEHMWYQDWGRMLLQQAIDFEAVEYVIFGEDERDESLEATLEYRAGPVHIYSVDADMIPTDFVDKDCVAGANEYLTDPSTPIELEVNWISLQEVVDCVTFDHKRASVHVQLPRMTIVEIVDFAKALQLSPPKVLFERPRGEKWCPAEYSELVKIPMSRHAIKVLEGQDVSYWASYKT